MRLVVDANILVAELIRKRGRQLITTHPNLELYMAEQAWSEVCHELSKRIAVIAQKGKFDQGMAEDLLASALALAEVAVSLVPQEIYAASEITAKARIPRDPDDWPTVALALVLDAGIWTSDQDLLGCGLPTWTTDTLVVHLLAMQE